MHGSHEQDGKLEREMRLTVLALEKRAKAASAAVDARKAAVAKAEKRAAAASYPSPSRQDEPAAPRQRQGARVRLLRCHSLIGEVFRTTMHPKCCRSRTFHRLLLVQSGLMNLVEFLAKISCLPQTRDCMQTRAEAAGQSKTHAAYVPLGRLCEVLKDSRDLFCQDLSSSKQLGLGCVTFMLGIGDLSS